MSVALENIPAELRNIPQWVAWRYGRPDPTTGKRRKFPVDPHTGNEAMVNTPATWGTFDAAMGAAKRRKLAGVGFVFTDDGDYTGIDFDDCLVDGKLTAEAMAAVRALDSYSEVSPSGNGVKVIVRARKPAGAVCKAEGALGCSRVEVYDRGRFFTLTGRRVEGTPATVARRQAELTALCMKLWPADGASKAAASATRKGKPVGGAKAVVRCQKYLATLDDAVSGAGGHNQTLRAACECFRFGLSDADALAMLQWFNENKCKPVWSGKELAHKLASAKAKVEAAGAVGIRLNEASLKCNGHTLATAGVPGKPVGEARAPWHNPLPGWIRNLERPRLRPYQTAILQAIANRCDAKPIDTHGSLGFAIVGYETLARATGMGVRTAIGHVQKLVAMGLLVKVETGGMVWKSGECKANIYGIPGAEGIPIQRGCAKPAYPHPLPTGLCGKQDLHTLNREGAA